MFNVYVQYFKRANGTINNSAELMFSIPKASGNFPVDKPVVKAQEDAADNFSFKMEATSPYYDALLPFKTRIRVDYDGDAIFYGQVLSINTNTIFQTKQVNCSGAYAFLNDTFYEGVQEKYRQKSTISDYLDKIIANHNTNAPSKEILRGNVTITLPTEQDKYEPTSWTQTSSLISTLKSNHGGHFKVRFSSGHLYIDWYKYFSRDLGDGNRPSVTVGKNILDISSASEVDNLFTRVIPIGSNNSGGQSIYLDGYVYTDKNGVSHTFSGKAFPVSLIKDLYTDQELTDEFHSAGDYANPESSYGIIYKTQSFPDADKQEKLWNEAKKWIKDSYFGMATSFTIKAIDMHIQDGNVPKILVGDRVDINYYIYESGAVTLKTKKYVCKSAQYDLFNPENNSYTFGVPSDILDRSKKTASGKGKSDSGGGPGKKPPPEESGNNFVLTTGSIADTIGLDESYDYGQLPSKQSFLTNGSMSGTIWCYDPGKTLHPTKADLIQSELVGKITLPGKSTKYVAFGSGEFGGLFAFVDMSTSPHPITHWYIHSSADKPYSLASPTPFIEVNFADEKIKVTPDMAMTFFKNVEDEAKEYLGIEPMNCSITVTDTGEKKLTISGLDNNISMIRDLGQGVIDPVLKIGESLLGPVLELFKGDGSNKKTVEVKGENGSLSLSKGDNTNNKTVEAKGADGLLTVGKSNNNNWLIKLNEPVTYVDEHGTTHTNEPGFVTSKDVQTEDVPSMDTQVAVFGEIMATKVSATEIDADIAYIRKINGSTIQAGTYVSSSHGYFSNLYGTNVYATGNLYYTSGGSNIAIQKCYNQCLITESAGTITLTMYPADGSSPVAGRDIATFNMAATSFYINAVAAAHDEGGATAYFTASRTVDLEPGWSSTIYAYYTNHSGTATRSSVSASGKYSSLTITAKTDANLLPENIKKDVEIFGVTGTYEGGSGGSWIFGNSVPHNDEPTASKKYDFRNSPYPWFTFTVTHGNETRTVAVRLS